jgi:Domain of Unknown Function (DUF1206)
MRVAVGRAEAAGQRAADSKALEVTARLGFVARGLLYILVGVIAVQIAVGHGGQADRGGALQAIASKSFGTVLLWVLVVGFAGLALWRFTEAAFGAVEPGGHKPGARGKSFARGVLYAFFTWSTLQLIVGASSSATANSNGQSRAATARVMAHTGGQVLVGVVGLVVLAIGAFLAREAWTRTFLQRMDFSGTGPGLRAAVEKLGLFGGLARGVVFGLAGIFLVVAAVRFQPSRAEGLDGTLRAFSRGPVGPYVLILVALGLVAFGLFSWCEARWRRI